MKQHYEEGDEVVLVEDWTWQNRYDYLVVKNSRPLKGMVGIVVTALHNYVVIDFSKATANDDLKTLCTDHRVVKLAPLVTDEEVEDAIQSILNPNV